MQGGAGEGGKERGRTQQESGEGLAERRGRLAGRLAGALGPAWPSVPTPRGRVSGGGQAATRYEDSSEMSSPRRAVYAPIRRSLSEQLRDSSARAWDLLWRNVRERRLAGRCPGALGADSDQSDRAQCLTAGLCADLRVLLLSGGRKGSCGCVPDWHFHVAHPPECWRGRRDPGRAYG